MLNANDLQRTNHSKWRFLSQEARAACIVGSMAELEALTRTFLVTLSQEINAGNHRVKDLKQSLRCLAGDSHFESLRSTNDAESLWQRRQFLTSLEDCAEIATLPIPTKGAQPPLDGKTLTPAHFNRIWTVLDIPGDPLPALAIQPTLTKLKGLRNDIARANLPCEEVLHTAGTTVPAIEKYMDHMTDLVIHLADNWERYTLDQGYLQQATQR